MNQEKKSKIFFYKHFPLFSALFFFVFPPTRQGESSLRDWNDQGLFRQSLEALQSQGDSSWSHLGWVGPAYSMFGKVFSRIFAIDSSSALVLMTRILFSASIYVICLSFQKIINSRKKNLNKLPSFTSLIVFYCILMLGIPILQYNDIPWTNFNTFFFTVVSMYLILDLQYGNQFVKHKLFLLGILCMFCRQTREADGIFLFLLICLSLIVISGFNIASLKSHKILVDFFRHYFYRISYLILGCVVGWILVGILAKDFTMFSQYWKTEEIFPRFKDLRFESFPQRIIQVFYDPCFNSLCTANEYQPLSFGYFENKWKQPILLQVPLIFAGLVSLFILSLTKRKFINFKNREFQLGALFLSAGFGHALLHTMLTVVNGAVLKFGTSREFFIPGVLILIGAALIFLSNDEENGLYIYLIGMLSSILIVVGIAWSSHLPKLDSHRFTKFETTIKNCSVSSCRIQLYGTNFKGDSVKFDPTGWVEVFFDKRFVDTSGESSLKNLPVNTPNSGEDPNNSNKSNVDYVSKWFTVDKNGELPLIAKEAWEQRMLIELHHVPISVGLQGTPTYTDNIQMFTIKGPRA